MTPKAETTWRTVRLGDFADINPSVHLKRGKEYPFMDMANVAPLSRTTKWQEHKVFAGSGSRFDEGDTLFARITPCLENGKITQAVKTGGPGFGSTEFYVLRGKGGVSDNDFVFYLTRTYRIRKIAEANMVGASGRQRVERTAFENILVRVPEDVNTQKHIAGILFAFDEKIENNNCIIKTLEEMARAIFKEWFINFRFPGHEKAEFVDSVLGRIPKGWEVKNVMEMVKRISVGKKYENKTALLAGTVPILDQGQSGCIGYHNDEPGVIASIDEPVVVFTNHTCNYRLVTYSFSAIQNVLPYIGRNGYSTLFVYYLTREKIVMQEYKGYWPEFEQQEFVVPPQTLADEYTIIIKPIVQKIVEAENENQKLAAMRDLLLPRLMSGELQV